MQQLVAPGRPHRGGGKARSTFAGVVARLTGANAVTLLSAVVTGPLVARALGPIGRGDVAAVAIPVSLASVVLMGGLASYVGRQVARGRPLGLLLPSVAPILLVASVIAVVVAFPIAGLLAPEGGAVHTALAVGFLLAPLGLLGKILLSVATFQERWRLTILMRLLPPGVMLVGTVGLYLAGELTVPIAVTLFLVSNYLTVLPVLPILWRMRSPRLDWGVTKAALSFGSRVWATAMATQTNARLDQLLMISLVARSELGLYAVAVNFSSLLSIFTNALTVPLSVRVAQGDRDAPARALRIALVLVLVLGGVLASLCPLALPLAFGRDFTSAVTMALILLIATVPQTGNSVLASALVSTDRPGAGATAQGLALVLTVPGLILLVPRLGGEGAALVSLGAYTAAFSFLLWSARKHIGGRYRDYLIVTRADLRWMRRTFASALMGKRRRLPPDHPV